MTNRLATLQAWQECMQEIEQQTDALIELTGSTPEASPLLCAIHALQGLATRQAAELTDTTADWLEAWWMEHRFGERPLRAGLVGDALRDIATLEELVALICDDEETTT